MKRRHPVVVPIQAHPPQSTDLALLADLLPPARVATLPRLLGELTPAQHHVLARAAVHYWTRDDDGRLIPYTPRNVHQRDVSLALCAPGVRLLFAWWSDAAQDGALDDPDASDKRGEDEPGEDEEWWPSFALTRLGALVARRVLRLVPGEDDREREREFDRMRALLRNKWETSD